MRTYRMINNAALDWLESASLHTEFRILTIFIAVCVTGITSHFLGAHFVSNLGVSGPIERGLGAVDDALLVQGSENPL